MTPQGIKYMSVEPGTGYGESAAQYIRGLRESGVPVTWTPLVNGAEKPEDGIKVVPFKGSEIGGCLHDDICNVDIAYDTVVVHIPPRCYEPWFDDERGKRLVSYCTWEADRLPDHWPDVLNRFDQVLVPSEFNRKAFVDSGVTAPVAVVPHAATTPPRDLGIADAYGDIDDEFVFYMISTWTTRKGVPESVTAVLDAVDGYNDCALILKTTALDHVVRERFARVSEAGEIPRSTNAWWSLADILRRYPSHPKVHLMSDELAPLETVEKLHRRGDCLVSLTRGEGFGLTPFEAAARGKPVVVTGWGGQLEYLPPDYPYLVDYELVPMANSEPDGWLELSPDHHWAEPDVAHGAKIIRGICDDRDAAADVGTELRAFVRTTFSLEVVTERLLRALDK